MKVLVVGASGRVGRELVQDLVADGHEVVAGTRHLDDNFGETVAKVNVDLLVDEATLVAQLRDIGPEAIYFVAGSRGQNLLQIDAFGAVKLESAADQLGIKRFIMLSSWNATQPSQWGEGLRDYNIAKFFGDRWLIDHTDLDWTILQPGHLVEKPALGKVAFNPVAVGENAIGDVAAVLAALLKAPNTHKHIIKMTEGSDSIAVAVGRLQSI
jgi:uncharacterized protein YbjT (DUF2867 family)